MSITRSPLAQPGATTGYRERVLNSLTTALAELPRVGSAVDVGAGDGWIARELQANLAVQVTPVEVVRRTSVFLEPVLYDGKELPFEDASHDLVYAVDSVHHADDPHALLGEMARVANRWLLLKDHTARNRLDRLELAVLDQLGNRRFGIESPGRYQDRFQWIGFLEQMGFTVLKLVHPARCHVGPLGALTNHLQFVALLERTARIDEPSGP